METVQHVPRWFKARHLTPSTMMSDLAILAAPPSSALPKLCTPKFAIACRLSVLRTLAEMLSALQTPLETKPRIKASLIL